jgi:tetratricopeptide (TPR) repeat protein
MLKTQSVVIKNRIQAKVCREYRGAVGEVILLLVAMLSPLMAQDVYQGAKTAFEEGRFSDAIALLANLPKNESLGPAPYNLKALAFAELHRYDEALAANQRARELDPGNPNYAYNAGLIYLDKGTPQRAELVFRDAIKDFPRSSMLYEGLGETLVKLNRFGEAEVCLDRAAQISPESASAYVARARLYYAVGDGDKLGTAASKAVGLEPRNYLACFYYGSWLMQYQGQLKQGTEYIRMSIELHPRFVDGLKTWGRIVSHEGRWAEAIRTYERAIAVDPSDDQLFYLLSVAYRKVGEDQKADQALSEYRKLARQ